MEDTVIMIEVRGVANNNPATGAPSFHGILQTGETLTADTSSISDADGPASPGYTYQWIEVRLSDSTEKDIKGATGSTYELVSQDVDRGIKLRLSFTDDAGNTEILNSATSADVVATGATRRLLWRGTMTVGVTGDGDYGYNPSPFYPGGDLDPASFEYASTTY